jgi:PAS domain S-box-containing protein
MNRFVHKALVLTILLVALFLASGAESPQPAPDLTFPVNAQKPAPTTNAPPCILLLYSNDRLLPANLRFDEGFRDALGQALGEHYELYTEFLDAVRFPGDERQDAMAAALRVRYQEHPPQVLVAGGSEALSFFQNRRNSLFPGTPLVFGGIRLPDKTKDPIGPDTIGVPMSLEIAPTLELALRLRPQTREVIVVSGSDRLGREWADTARADFQPFASRVKITFWSELPLAELTRRARTLSPDTVVFFLTYLQEPDGAHLSSSAHALELFAAKCSAPIFGPYDTYIGKGIVGGLMTDFAGEGVAVAGLVQRLLAGETPQAIGIQPPRPEVFQFDARQLDRWDIPASRLPAGSKVFFREPTLWQAYAPELTTAGMVMAVQAWLIGWLLFQRRQRHRTESQLRESEQRFRSLADTAPVMIWMSGPDQKCHYFNQRWLDFTGRPLEMELGDGWIASVHPDDVEARVAGYRKAFESRTPLAVEYRLRRHDGPYHWILVQAVPRLTASGEFLGYVGSCLDITDHKQMEEANRNLAHVARVSTMGQLASALAHELNQPLGAILRNAEAGELVMQQNPPDYEEVRAILTDIRKDDQRASAVIDRMRSLLKRRNLEFEPLLLNQLVDQVKALVRADLQSRRVTLLVDLPADLPPVRGDRVHLQQVLLNLIMNGADALNGAPPEQRRLEVRARCVNAETVEVSVRDFGHGIADSKLPDIFEPFFSTKPNGMGMGLAISKTIIEAHGGRIGAENHPDGGATFRFTVKPIQPGGPL